MALRQFEHGAGLPPFPIAARPATFRGMLLKTQEPINGVANYLEVGVNGAICGHRIVEVRLDARDLDHLRRLNPAALHDWVNQMLTRFPPS
jgi:hypothetical protein